VISVGLVFSVQILIARSIGTGRHGGHPEVIGIGSKGIVVPPNKVGPTATI
jgi:hypothetical protein